MYRSDPDPGIHAAAEWVLRRWGQAEYLAKIDSELLESADKQPQWYLTKHRHTMIAITGPVEFLMGSPHSQRGRSTTEYLHRKRINHSFAIASKEVTVQQFHEFLENHSFTSKDAPEADCPQTSVTWYEAVAYCRWLSDQENIHEDQMCYPSIDEIKDGMTLPSDYLSRNGYRLPTEAEWEFACRANSVTSRYYGETDQLLGQYAWYDRTSDYRTWPVGVSNPATWGSSTC